MGHYLSLMNYDFFQFVDHVYNVEEIFEEEQDICVGEASAFFLMKNSQKEMFKHMLHDLDQQLQRSSPSAPHSHRPLPPKHQSTL